MKIDKTRKAGSIAQSSPSGAKAKVTPGRFEELFQDEHQHQQRQALEKRLLEIKEKGEELSKRRTVELLLDYKKMIRSFVKDAVEFGLKIEQKRGFSRGGRSKLMSIVAQVDNALVSLTDEILAKEQKQLRILEKIGEVQGLLVNIFA